MDAADAIDWADETDGTDGGNGEPPKVKSVECESKASTAMAC